MARKSFLIQKYESDSGAASVYGSYLQYPIGSEAASVGLSVRTDDDNRLKADDLSTQAVLATPVTPGNQTPTYSFFNSEIVNYNEIELSWGAPLVDSVGLSPEATRVLIVYSDLGEPQTVVDGVLLVSTSTASTFTHFLTPGKWAYYSMFLKYENSSGSVFYDRVATLAELPPFEYGCTEDMYSKIPEYYRRLDGDLDNGDGGPLKRMISLFGFEADRLRTTIDYLMSCKDPLIANSEVLKVIAKDLTVAINPDELGASRLRNLLDDIGLVRRTLGTPLSTILIAQAATGSEASINTSGVLPTVDIYAQRVNLLKDPNISGGAAGSLVGGTPRTLQFTSTFEAGGVSASVDTTYEGGTPYSSLSPYDEFADADELFQEEINEQYWQYSPDPSSGGSLSYLKTVDNYIPLFSGESVYFSMHGDFTDNAQDKILRVALYAPVPGTAASAGYSGTEDDSLICEATNPVTIAGIKYWELVIPDGEPEAAIGDSSLTLFVDSSVNISNGFQKLLLEKMQGGAYFDGDTAEGGWVINYSTGARISDYRWYNPEDPSSDEPGPAQASYSIYNSNYKKTRALADRYLPQILPVTQISYSDVVYSNDYDSNTTPIWTLKWNDVKGLEDLVLGTF